MEILKAVGAALASSLFLIIAACIIACVIAVCVIVGLFKAPLATGISLFGLLCLAVIAVVYFRRNPPPIDPTATASGVWP